MRSKEISALRNLESVLVILGCFLLVILFFQETGRTERRKQEAEEKHFEQLIEVNKKLSIVEQATMIVEAQSTPIVAEKLSTETVKPVLFEGQGGLLDIKSPDDSYSTRVVEITGKNRKYLEALVMGEAGGEDFTGQALVAQALKDTMLLKGSTDVLYIKKELKYSAPLTKTPTQSVKDAVEYVFDDGGYAVRHQLVYFYAPKLVKSRFHESQKFVVEHGCHRFFDIKA